MPIDENKRSHSSREYKSSADSWKSENLDQYKYVVFVSLSISKKNSPFCFACLSLTSRLVYWRVINSPDRWLIEEEEGENGGKIVKFNSRAAPMQNFGSGVRACYGTFHFNPPFSRKAVSWLSRLFFFFFLFEWKCKLALLLLPLIHTSRQKIGISKFAHHLRVDCVEFYFGSSSWGTWGVEGDGWDDTSSSACEIDSSWSVERDKEREREGERESTWQQE